MRLKRIRSGKRIKFVFIMIATIFLISFFIINFNKLGGNGEYIILLGVIMLIVTPFTFYIDIYEDFLVYHYYIFIRKKVYKNEVKKIEYTFGIKAGEPTYSLKITLKNKQYVKINAKAFDSKDLKEIEKFLQGTFDIKKC
ncbi:hypothetical protein [Acinetobacter haemolyticus]|uniref:hypothetical protein n=1 Tax=Acinetobacter haemolyticus TaxID=29430 RepID=UPI000D687909|nr:hypothetical protein [Acinetobacter haemolyticus]